ncbi:3-oxoacyl-ACP synthase [Leptospira alexanderi]|uniref:3-oxoacyl-ACP synthase n=1 Tax=Leptospira alexanderi TaxID=100053 RepID=UPI000990D125|nr:3-oxoacyl-ACP synthase [Leptospira alexanderi]
MFLYNIAYRLGETQSISQLSSFTDDDQIELLRTLGLSNYCKMTKSLKSEISLTIADTLKEIQEPIDALVVSTSTLNDKKVLNSDLSEALVSNGLENIPPIGVFLSDCGNIVSALRVCKGLIENEGKKQILLILFDRCVDEKDRLMKPAISILSDAVATCLISAVPISESYQITNIVQISNHKVRLLDPDQDFLKHLKFFGEGIKKLGEDFYSLNNTEPSAYDHLITNNYNLSVLRLIYQQLRMTSEVLYKDNLANIAHSFSMDTLIALKNDFHGNIALLSTGVSTWGLFGARRMVQ